MSWWFFLLWFYETSKRSLEHTAGIGMSRNIFHFKSEYNMIIHMVQNQSIRVISCNEQRDEVTKRSCETFKGLSLRLGPKY